MGILLKNQNFSNRKHGFSLASILVGVAMMGLLSVGMMKLFSNSLKGQKTVEQKHGADNIEQDTRTNITLKTGCLNTFNGVASQAAFDNAIATNTPIAVPAIRDAGATPGNVIITPNTTYPRYGHIQVSNLQLATIIDYGVQSDSRKKYGADLVMSLRDPNRQGAAVLKDHLIKVTFVFKAVPNDPPAEAGQLYNCFALGSSDYFTAQDKTKDMTFNANVQVTENIVGPKVIQLSLTNPALTQCGPDQIGSIIYSPVGNRLMHCNGINWRPVGPVIQQGEYTFNNADCSGSVDGFSTCASEFQKTIALTGFTEIPKVIVSVLEATPTGGTVGNTSDFYKLSVSSVGLNSFTVRGGSSPNDAAMEVQATRRVNLTSMTGNCVPQYDGATPPNFLGYYLWSGSASGGINHDPAKQNIYDLGARFTSVRFQWIAIQD